MITDKRQWFFVCTGYSGVDQESAVYLLSRIMKHFISIIADEAHCIPNGDGEGFLSDLLLYIIIRV